MHDDSPTNRDKDKMMILKEKVKRNIANCRQEMVGHKTQSFKDAHGNLPQGRGMGKGGKPRGRGRGKVGKDDPSKICSSFLTLCGMAMNKTESDNETGPIGGFLTAGGGEGEAQPVVSGTGEEVSGVVATGADVEKARRQGKGRKVRQA